MAQEEKKEEEGDFYVGKKVIKYSEDDGLKVVKLQARVRGNRTRKSMGLPINEVDSFPVENMSKACKN